MICPQCKGNPLVVCLVCEGKHEFDWIEVITLLPKRKKKQREFDKRVAKYYKEKKKK